MTDARNTLEVVALPTTTLDVVTFPTVVFTMLVAPATLLAYVPFAVIDTAYVCELPSEHCSNTE